MSAATLALACRIHMAFTYATHFDWLSPCFIAPLFFLQSSIVLTPVFVKLVLGGMDVSLDAVDLLVKMIVSILVPLLVGKGMRELLKPVREFVTKYRLPIYMFTNFQISSAARQRRAGS